MDALATFGSLVVSEGDTAALALARSLPSANQHQYPPRDWTAQDRDAVDAVFAAPVTVDDGSPLGAVMVMAASVTAMKGVALDEARRSDEDEEEELRDQTESKSSK